MHPCVSGGEPATEGTAVGRDEGFDAFCEASYPRLVTGLTHILSSRAAAEDTAQEALLRAYLRWPRVRELDSPLGWTLHVGANLARSRLRRRRTRAEAAWRMRSAADAPGLPPPDGTTLERVVVDHLLTQLSHRDREILVLRYLLELPADQVGDLLGISADAVRQRTARAKRTARTLLTETDVASGTRGEHA
ncbi:sigma-70 family RNA polymerase sigma factor [Nitriliruptoraceae bacterium ZYF776]|nr:sigma-70 family RNA polymerase sigma factor [Profundirhabdus halotolerans]